MDDQKKPLARRKKIVGEGKAVEKKGEGLGTGPVGQSSQRPPQSSFTQQAAQQGKQQSNQSAQQSSARPSGSAQRPAQSTQAGRYTQDAMKKAGQGSTAGHSQGSGRPSFPGSFQQPAQRPARPAQRPASTGSITPQRPPVTGGGTQQRSSAGGTQRAGGGGSKLLILVIAAVALFFFGQNFFGGNGGEDPSLNSIIPQTTSTASQTNQNSSQAGTAVNTGTDTGLMNLLNTFMGGSTSSAYDFSGILSGLTGGTSAQTGGTGSADQYFTSSMENNTLQADTTVAKGAREKYTTLLGGKKDEITILLYMCGTDLESQNGMGTADLKEMLNANLSEKVNLIVYTGGCRKWRNNVISSGANQIYQIKNGSLTRLKENMGTASMTNPSTLAEFIRFGAEHFPANRMCLIFWDHGGGSVSGYGYDERYGSGQSMTLAGINEALKNGGVKFDFVGFDACLMATVENGLMLGQYADYMIASEETEPGVGWYYTNWLNKLSANTSMNTVELGKIITDDFVEVCNKQCRGQATTLSVVDLAELAATVPEELKTFSVDTNELIQNNEYKKVSSARSRTREFAASTKIDQIDLVHFAKNMGTSEGKELADALLGAVKYNRTGGGISNAYGLSIYFPYKKAGKVNQMVSTYKAIGMDDEYTRCIQEFASLEVSGQLSAGADIGNYGSSTSGLGASGSMTGLLESLMGGGSGNSYYNNVSTGYSSSDSLSNLLGGILGSSGESGNTGSILDLLSGRSMTTEKAAAYIFENHFDPSALVWNNDRMTLEPDQWGFIESVSKNLYYDDGTGYIDLGYDPLCTIEGNDLVNDYDGTWLSINRQPVAYYRTALIEQEDCYAETGYTPAIVNGVRANLILVFDAEHPDGTIAGAETVYRNGETETAAKNMIAIGEGTEIQFVCDFYDYEGNYKDSYRLGDPMVLEKDVLIGYAYVPEPEKCRVTYCLTDYYQESYWTPAVSAVADAQ